MVLGAEAPQAPQAIIQPVAVEHVSQREGFIVCLFLALGRQQLAPAVLARAMLADHFERDHHFTHGPFPCGWRRGRYSICTSSYVARWADSHGANPAQAHRAERGGYVAPSFQPLRHAGAGALFPAATQSGQVRSSLPRPIARDRPAADEASAINGPYVCSPVSILAPPSSATTDITRPHVNDLPATIAATCAATTFCLPPSTVAVFTTD